MTMRPVTIETGSFRLAEIAAFTAWKSEVKPMRRGFTAIELAVVLILIAVMAVLILPALEKGRVAAIRTKCITNIRQIGVACSMYENDHNAEWPWARVSVDDSDEHPVWPDATGSIALLYPDYAPKPYLFRCPDTDDLVVFSEDGTDFLNCENFNVSPDGEAMNEGDEGKGAPRPPSYFYDAGDEHGPGIPKNPRPSRVVYGDECIHHYWENEAGEGMWMGENNHVGGGNFLCADKHVDWLAVHWSGTPYRMGESEPSVPNTFLHVLPGPNAMPGDHPQMDSNVFWAEEGHADRAVDADLAGMMWLNGRWNEF